MVLVLVDIAISLMPSHGALKSPLTFRSVYLARSSLQTLCCLEATLCFGALKWRKKEQRHIPLELLLAEKGKKSLCCDCYLLLREM